MSETPERDLQPKKSLDKPVTRRQALAGLFGLSASGVIDLGLLGKLSHERFQSAEEKNQMLERVNEELSTAYGKFIEKNASKFVDPAKFNLARTSLFAKDITLDPLTIHVGIFYFDRDNQDQLTSNEIGGYAIVLQKGETLEYEKHIEQPVLALLDDQIPKL